MPRFHDRRAAGRALARLLDAYRGDPRTIVLALPRGGVPVAYEVASALRAPSCAAAMSAAALPVLAPK